jgi:hypothetical protein
MKNMKKLMGIIALVALTWFFVSGCKIIVPGNNGPGDIDDNFIPVTNITGVNTSVVVGTVSLSGKVVPSDATNQTIIWSLQPGGDTEGTISGNSLTTKEEGFIKVRATIKDGIAKGEDFIKDYYISIDPFVAVSHIVYDGPTVDEVGEIYLDATVYPDDASYTDIIWFVKNAGRTKATINGDVLTTKAEGTVIVRATIINGTAEGKNYSQDFSILVKDDIDDDDPD